MSITHATNRPLDPTPPALPTHTIWRLATDESGTPTLRPTRWVGSEADMYSVLRTAPEGDGYYLTQKDVDDSPGALTDGLDYAIDEMTGHEYTWPECGGRNVAILDWVCRFMDLPMGDMQVSEILLLVEVES